MVIFQITDFEDGIRFLSLPYCEPQNQNLTYENGQIDLVSKLEQSIKIEVSWVTRIFYQIFDPTTVWASNLTFPPFERFKSGEIDFHCHK